MAPSKRNRSVTLAKSPPESPIRPITKRPRQKTPEPTFASSSTLPLLLRPTRPTSTSTPTAFNSSQVDESEFEEERRAQVISESESEESKKENDINQANEFLDQDLKELGLDRLNKEDINKSDAKIKVSKEFKNSKFFDQSVIDLEGKLSFKLPSKEAVIGSSSSTYYLLVFYLI